MVSSSKDGGGGGVLGGVSGDGAMDLALRGWSSNRTCRLLCSWGLRFVEDRRIERGLVTRPLWTWWCWW